MDSPSKKLLPEATQSMGRVFVYLNTRYNVFSIRSVKTKKVVDYAHSVLLRDATFTVGKSGRRLALKTRQRNVHAGVTGTQVNNIKIKVGQPITYKPFKAGYFYYRCNGRPIHEADLVLLKGQRIYLAEEL